MIIKLIKIIGVVFLLAAIMGGLVVWKIRSDDSCLMFGNSYTELKTLAIDGRPYYVYWGVSGFQDKVNLVALSDEKISEANCDFKEKNSGIYSIVVDDDKVVKKLLITRKREAGFNLEVVYQEKGQAQTLSDLPNISVEVDGKAVH